MTKKYDFIVIGKGPAGITSAIYLARRKLKILLVYREHGQTAVTAKIENYSGFKIITGIEFTEKLNLHLKDYHIDSLNDSVIDIKKTKDRFKIKTKNGDYVSRGLIIATGSKHKMLGVPGEIKFLNRGVSYCTTCDGPFFKNRIVAVVGGGNSALTSALQLKDYAKKIYLITKNEKMKGEQVLIDKVKSFKNIKIFYSSKVNQINGDKNVKSILVLKNKKILKEINVQGVFVEIGYKPNSEMFDLEKNDVGEIKINEKNETSIKGIFAAGDVTTVPMKQIIVAAGEGAKAAMAAADYLDRNN